jgi:hypothetical protein
MSFTVKPCPVNEQDIIEWWTILNDISQGGGSLFNGANSPDGSTCFLYGYYDAGVGSPVGQQSGQVTLINTVKRVIFPTVNGRHTDANVAKSEENQAHGMYANIRRGDQTINIIDHNRRQQAPVMDPQSKDLPYYDGHWICLAAEDLMKGDKVKFGGSGSNGFKTDAEYEIM